MTAAHLNLPSPPAGQDLATVPMRFEVTPIPVTDFDRAEAFYQRLGWQLDIDLQSRTSPWHPVHAARLRSETRGCWNAGLPSAEDGVD